jgi:YVTN family beta-propeller protein
MKYLLILPLLILFLSVNAQETNTKALNLNTRQYSLPYNRLIQPAGKYIQFGLPNMENHALDAALSPDGKWLAVMERYTIVFISTETNKVTYTLIIGTQQELFGGMNTYSGIIWYNGDKGPEVFWSAIGVNDRSFVVSAAWDGKEAKFNRIFEYNTIPPAYMALPNEILINRENNIDYLYVVLNGCNRLVKQNLITRDTVWITDPGVAPYGLTMAAGKLYVTNWAGRHPLKDDKEVAGLPWGSARVDNKSGGGTREGSVTVIDPLTGKIIKEIIAGLHPNDIVRSKTGKFVYVTNSNSDNISVIRTSTDVVTETISVRLQPEINPYFGDSPNGLCVSKDDKKLYVANGMDNAVAVIELGKKANSGSKLPESRVTGFIPTGAYPSAVTVTRSGMMYVCNLEGAGVTFTSKLSGTANPVYNSHRMQASVTAVRIPGSDELNAYTDTVVALNDVARALSAREAPRPNIEPKTVPERIGEPSVFKHVLYIIKENRTYDQVLGDMKEGNGDPAICIYGEQITPNQHKLAREFLLLDNYHVSGKSSAEGHQWTDAAIVTDYIEKNMRAWFRSYAHVQTDALVYAPTGFLWDNAVKHGKSVRIYGEASIPEFPVKRSWPEVYAAFKKGEKVDFKNVTTIAPVEPILSQTYPSYGNHEFSDVMRADAFIKELHYYESQEGDQLPELMIMALPNNHTAGTRPGYPTPRAMVADNDVALGQIVEALSKSRFWKNTVIFVTEDDSQGGWDHVSAFRTVGYVLSPWSRLKTTSSTYYTQPAMVRTIEQILGLPPMNIQDAIAAPMSDCFGQSPDFTPYKYLPNNIPIDEMNPGLSQLSGKALHFAKKSMLPVFDGIDSGKDDLLNRILWFSARGKEPYPAKYAGAEEDEGDEDVPRL